MHDRIGGSPGVTQSGDCFIQCAIKHKNVTFLRKYQIAQIVLNEKEPMLDESE
jgi:hypothetical protein